MKIAAVLVTRGNPKRAAAVLEALRSLQSGQHEIVYVVGCDHDDPSNTADYFHAGYPDIVLTAGERPLSVASVWNRGAKLVPDAGIICPFPDDSFPGVPDWDDLIVRCMSAIPQYLGVLAWNDTANPGLCTLPAISRGWYETAGLYPEHFPYWFYDTWLAEVYSYVAGRVPLIPQELLLIARKGKTQNLRELSFWWDFYSKTRQLRFEEAKTIRERLSIPILPERLELMAAHWKLRDAEFRPRLRDMETSMSAEGSKAASQQYLMARADAERMMAEVQNAP